MSYIQILTNYCCCCCCCYYYYYDYYDYYYHYHYHHHHHFTSPWTLSGTTRVSRYQKGKTRKVKPIWIYWSNRS